MANYYDPKAYAKLPGRSKFDLSYRNSFTARMGQLIPVVCESIVPGDRFRVGLTYQMQLAPMLNPVYDALEVNFEAFFVPNRILDPKWREFWTGYNDYDQMTPVDVAPLTMTIRADVGTPEGSDTPDFVNYRSIDAPVGTGSLLDFLGIQFSSYSVGGYPKNPDVDGIGNWFTYLPKINAYPVLAYLRLWDDWYRNERTQQSILKNYYNQGLVAGDRNIDISASYEEQNTVLDWYYGSSLIRPAIQYRNYKKDRFTTALPEPIIGGDVRIPVNYEANFMELANEGDSNNEIIYNLGEGYNLNALALGTIQQLKLAFKEYSYKMKDTYNGNRYVESLYAHYGVVVPDSTLQRSIYLGSARDYVNFGEVYQTSAGDGDGANGALGDYAGRGAANGTHYLFDESFYECGHFFVLMSISPRSRYFQGIKRMFTRFERSDYFSPEYQNIGDDFLMTSELFNVPWRNDDSFDNSVFGYNSRWIELKDRYDELHGDFANPDSPMFNWNFSRAFKNAPIISPEFSAIRPINKPFVDLSDANDNYFVDVAIKMEALRPILAVESF